MAPLPRSWIIGIITCICLTVSCTTTKITGGVDNSTVDTSTTVQTAGLFDGLLKFANAILSPYSVCRTPHGSCAVQKSRDGVPCWCQYPLGVETGMVSQ